MDNSDLIELRKIHQNLLKKSYSLFNESKTADIEKAQKMETVASYLNIVNEELTEILKINTDFAKTCVSQATEIRNTIETNDMYKDNPNKMMLAYQHRFKNISWADLDEQIRNEQESIQNVKNTIKNTKQVKATPILYKKLKNIYGVKTGFLYNIPVINKINEIPSAMYWFNGDKDYTPGIYTSPSNGVYIKVPFPNVIDSTKNHFRTGSIKCRNGTIDECNKFRDEFSKYKSSVNSCNFAHVGDAYVKIGNVFRCNEIPRFGNYAYLSDDLSTIQETNIRTMLMYSLSDLLLGSLWFQKNKKNNIIIEDVDIC